MKSTIMRNMINEAEYPKLMEGKTSGSIFLLTSAGIGVIVKPGPYHKLGEYSEGWDENSMKPFNGSVLLES